MQTASEFVTDRAAFVSRVRDAQTSRFSSKYLDASYFAKPENRLLKSRRRTWADILLGRQTFFFASFRFSVQRGTLASGPEYYLRDEELLFVR
jgi:hypothetical protein